MPSVPRKLCEIIEAVRNDNSVDLQKSPRDAAGKGLPDRVPLSHTASVCSFLYMEFYMRTHATFDYQHGARSFNVKSDFNQTVANPTVRNEAAIF